MAESDGRNPGRSTRAGILKGVWPKGLKKSPSWPCWTLAMRAVRGNIHQSTLDISRSEPLRAGDYLAGVGPAPPLRPRFGWIFPLIPLGCPGKPHDPWALAPWLNLEEGFS